MDKLMQIDRESMARARGKEGYFPFVAELQRAKRASEAPWVSKIGNPSSRENLVMTSACEGASERRPYRLWGRGRGVSR